MHTCIYFKLFDREIMKTDQTQVTRKHIDTKSHTKRSVYNIYTSLSLSLAHTHSRRKIKRLLSHGTISSL